MQTIQRHYSTIEPLAKFEHRGQAVVVVPEKRGKKWVMKWYARMGARYGEIDVEQCPPFKDDRRLSECVARLRQMDEDLMAIAGRALLSTLFDRAGAVESAV